MLVRIQKMCMQAYKHILLSILNLPLIGNTLLGLGNFFEARIDFLTVGEIDCPNPKQINSPLTQNQFLILERILSDN